MFVATGQGSYGTRVQLEVRVNMGRTAGTSGPESVADFDDFAGQIAQKDINKHGSL